MLFEEGLVGPEGRALWDSDGLLRLLVGRDRLEILDAPEPLERVPGRLGGST